MSTTLVDRPVSPIAETSAPPEIRAQTITECRGGDYRDHVYNLASQAQSALAETTFYELRDSGHLMVAVADGERTAVRDYHPSITRYEAVQPIQGG